MFHFVVPNEEDQKPIKRKIKIVDELAGNKKHVSEKEIFDPAACLPVTLHYVLLFDLAIHLLLILYKFSMKSRCGQFKFLKIMFSCCKLP